MNLLPPDSSFDPAAFDARVRASCDDSFNAAPTPSPSPRAWAGVQARLRPASPAPKSATRPALLGAGSGALLGMLLMWCWLMPPAVPAARPVAQTPSAVPQTHRLTAQVFPAPPRANRTSPQVTRVTSRVDQLTPRTILTTPKKLPATPPATSATPEKLPATTPAIPAILPVTLALADHAAGPAIPASLLPLLQTEAALTALASDSTSATRQARRTALLAQQTELTRLRTRTDSLLRVLDGAAIALSPPAVTDSVVPESPKRRWSVMLAFAPERNFFGLGAPAADTLSALRRTHEQGRGGYNANVMAEYRLDSRLSVGAGLGVASYGAELRLTEQRTTVSTRLDSVTNTFTSADSVITNSYIVRRVRDSVLVPILDYNNVVTGYQYALTYRYDTVRTHLTNMQITTHTTTTYTPTVTTRQETSARILKPNYRFLTVPLLVRYRLGRATDWTSSPTAPRWWADVAVGAQLQWFLGGTQASTRDGLTYHTERVGPRGGPFRPFNLALTGAVALNYALTPRFSASLAPTLRYQMASVYKSSTNLTQRPTATGVQLGLKYAF